MKLFCIPHPRGDGPWVRLINPGTVVYSPPAWGWSDNSALSLAIQRVFPTRVGMVRAWCKPSAIMHSIPHPRGDGPMSNQQYPALSEYSPPAWGWSAVAFSKADCALVFPTRVGMVRFLSGGGVHNGGIPHPRGDGPALDNVTVDGREYSPPAWGWSGSQGGT